MTDTGLKIVSLRDSGGGGGMDPPDQERMDVPCPLVFLGHNQGTHYFIAPSGQRRSIKGSQLHKREVVIDLVESQADWFFQVAPRRNDKDAIIGINHQKLQEILIEMSANVGLYDVNQPQRALGTWRDHRAGPDIDGGLRPLIIHTGNYVEVEGVRRRAGWVEEGVFYSTAPAIEPPADTPATTDDWRTTVRRTAMLWAWRRNCDMDIWLGWLACAYYAGALSWRPHIFVSAREGSGKSELMQLALAALGPAGWDPGQDATPAGIKGELDAQSRAVLIDELETDGGARVHAVLEMIRLTSSGKGSRSLRGGPGGGSRSTTLTGIFYMTSILAPAMKAQDASRITRVMLDPLQTDETAQTNQIEIRKAIDALRLLAPKFWRRAITGWRQFNATFDTVRLAMLSSGAIRPRMADQFAVLAAGYFLMHKDAAPTASDIEALIATWTPAFESAQEQSEKGEGERCLDHLLSTRSGLIPQSVQTVGADILSVQKALYLNHTDAAEKRRKLMQIGIRVDYDSRLGVTQVFIANDHSELRKIYRDTDWKGGTHANGLSLLHGAVPSKGAKRFAGMQSRAWVLSDQHFPDFNEACPPAPPDG